MIGIAPYAALNFASYDMLKKSTYESGVVKPNVVTNLLLGATAGTLATSVCYPLDTVRRRLQVRGTERQGGKGLGQTEPGAETEFEFECDIEPESESESGIGCVSRCVILNLDLIFKLSVKPIWNLNPKLNLAPNVN